MAVNAGADAIGLVFYEPSSRYASVEQASEIAKAVGPFVTVVGLFVNAERREIENVLNNVPLHLLQFHGDETAEFCDSFHRPYMKAIRMKPELDVMRVINTYPNAVGILLDAYQKGVPGGTGETFDWDRVPSVEQRSIPIILAGGLTPDNVSLAVATIKPYGIDVSGGVEQAPAQKDQNKIINFIHNATINNAIIHNVKKT